KVWGQLECPYGRSDSIVAEASNIRGPGGDQNRIRKVDRNVDFRCAIFEEVFDCEQVVGARSYHGERVQVYANNIGQYLLKSLTFILHLSPCRITDGLDCHDKKCTRATG